MISLDREKLKKILLKSYEEGRTGYDELREGIIDQLLDEAQEASYVEVKKTPSAPSVTVNGNTYTLSGTGFTLGSSGNYPYSSGNNYVGDARYGGGANINNSGSGMIVSSGSGVSNLTELLENYAGGSISYSSISSESRRQWENAGTSGNSQLYFSYT